MSENADFGWQLRYLRIVDVIALLYLEGFAKYLKLRSARTATFGGGESSSSAVLAMYRRMLQSSTAYTLDLPCRPRCHLVPVAQNHAQ